MAWHVECGCWSWCVLWALRWRGQILILQAGPAHAVYFATYEAVKQVLGGNQAGVHHPVAAGMLGYTFSRAHGTDFL